MARCRRQDLNRARGRELNHNKVRYRERDLWSCTGTLRPASLVNNKQLRPLRTVQYYRVKRLGEQFQPQSSEAELTS
jgi:hypothetical protein